MGPAVPGTAGRSARSLLAGSRGARARKAWTAFLGRALRGLCDVPVAAARAAGVDERRGGPTASGATVVDEWLADGYDLAACQDPGLVSEAPEVLDVVGELVGRVWLAMLLPGNGGSRRNPPGTTKAQARHLVGMLGP